MSEPIWAWATECDQPLHTDTFHAAADILKLENINHNLSEILLEIYEIICEEFEF